jgi:formylglycine-generating enzyme required for sulfatase activity
MKKIYLFALLICCCMAFRWDNTSENSENRLALIIGNGAYTGNHDPLSNPVNDVNTMKTTLKALGFEVIIAKNITLKGFNDAADKFEKRINKLKNSSKPLVTLFYYSGHGMHVGSTSYLLPIDCKAESEADLERTDEYGGYPLHYITNRLTIHGNYLNIVMLDACRNNPFLKKMIAAKGKDPDLFEGYAPPKQNPEIKQSSGMFYAYATAKGEIAKDGYNNNSPYVLGFKEALETPNLTLEQVLKQTGSYVNSQVKTQRPCMESFNFYGDFIFYKKELPKDTDGDGYTDDIDGCIDKYSKTNNGCPEDSLSDPFDNQMVRIPSGTFSMGSNKSSDEKPIHSVTLSSFYMSKYEVTQKQWREIMGEDPPELAFKGCDQCPVERVSWNDIQEFIKKLNNKTGKNYRLPTEAEWEYAARGGQNYKYAGSDNIEDVAWYSSNSDSKTHPVGQKSENGYGLYDMSGNVWEWCEDVWHKNYSGAPTNGSAWTSGGNSARRVLRGGSWSDTSVSCRAASRFNAAPTYGSNVSGFRLVLP